MSYVSLFQLPPIKKFKHSPVILLRKLFRLIFRHLLSVAAVTYQQHRMATKLGKKPKLVVFDLGKHLQINCIFNFLMYFSVLWDKCELCRSKTTMIVINRDIMTGQLPEDCSFGKIQVSPCFDMQDGGNFLKFIMYYVSCIFTISFVSRTSILSFF